MIALLNVYGVRGRNRTAVCVDIATIIYRPVQILCIVIRSRSALEEDALLRQLTDDIGMTAIIL